MPAPVEQSPAALPITISQASAGTFIVYYTIPDASIRKLSMDVTVRGVNITDGGLDCVREFACEGNFVKAVTLGAASDVCPSVFVIGFMYDRRVLL